MGAPGAQHFAACKHGYNLRPWAQIGKCATCQREPNMCLIRDVFKGLCGSRLCQSTLSDSRYWANLEVEVYFDSAHTPRVVMQHERSDM